MNRHKEEVIKKLDKVTARLLDLKKVVTKGCEKPSSDEISALNRMLEESIAVRNAMVRNKYTHGYAPGTIAFMMGISVDEVREALNQMSGMEALEG